jgi:T cell receptor alpha chain V region
VTQPDARVTVSEGASLQLRCKYSYSGTPYLFWYVQYPRQGLQLLLKYYSGDPVVQGVNGFEAEFSKSNSSFHLRKASVHWSDSAVYFCVLSAQCVGLQGELNKNTDGRGCSESRSLLWSLWHLFGLGEERRKVSQSQLSFCNSFPTKTSTISNAQL